MSLREVLVGMIHEYPAISVTPTCCASGSTDDPPNSHDGVRRELPVRRECPDHEIAVVFRKVPGLSSTREMSTATSGATQPRFTMGSKLFPPAMTLAPSPRRRRSSQASLRLSAGSYSKARPSNRCSL